MNFPSIARFFARSEVLGLGGSTLVHAGVAGLVYYLLLSLPQIWEFNVRRGEAVVIQAQMATVAVAQSEPITEVEISAEPTPLAPPPPVAVDHSPVRDTLEAVPLVLPIARNGEHEPLDMEPAVQPPETPRQVAAEAHVPPRKQPRQEPLNLLTAVAAKMPPREVADQSVVAESSITVAAIAPAEAGAQVDELPSLSPYNREPYYPLDALQAGREGRVVLLVKITSAGRAADIRVARSSGTPSLDASAIATVRDWQFSPAKRQGRAVVHEALVPVNFRIRRG